MIARAFHEIAFLALAVALLGCEREQRRIHENDELNKPTVGSTMNPDVAAGPAATAPLDREPQPPIDPYSGNAFMVGQGKQLYNSMNCVGCHAAGGGGMGPALMDDKWIYGIEPQNLYLSIVEGRPNGMPSYRGKLTNMQTWQLVAYVRSMSGQLRKDVEPSRTDHMTTRPVEQSMPKEQPRREGQK